MKGKKLIAAAMAAAVLFASVPVFASEGYNETVTSRENTTDQMTENSDFSAAPETTVTPIPSEAPMPTPELTVTPLPTATPIPEPTVKPGWVKTDKGYYWRQEDGTRLKKEGVHVLNGKKYYIRSSGYRSSSAWKIVDNKYYYFQKNGVMYETKGWFTVKNEKFYLGKGGYRITGFKKIDGKKYYFNKYGRLVRDKKALLIDGKYYDIAKNGVTTQLSTAKVQCSKEARSFIQKHTNSSMSNYQKLRACYSYLLAYMHYRPKAFNAAEFVGSDWPYTRALSVFQSSLTGNCYGFACCVAACAKELGYEPYVIITTGDHGFVMINGLYYDNMYATFGSSSHFAYNTYLKVKF